MTAGVSSVSITTTIPLAIIGWVLFMIIVIVLIAIMIYKKRMKQGTFDAM